MQQIINVQDALQVCKICKYIFIKYRIKIPPKIRQYILRENFSLDLSIIIQPTFDFLYFYYGFYRFNFKVHNLGVQQIIHLLAIFISTSDIIKERKEVNLGNLTIIKL